MTNLFLLQRHLGDTVMTTGIIDACKEEPAVIIATKTIAQLLADAPNVERLLIVNRQSWKKHWHDIWRETHHRSWNHFISFKQSPLPFLLKAQQASLWLAPPINTIHRVNQLSHWFGSTKPLAPTLWIKEERLARMKPTRPTLAVAPIPGWPGKQWPMERFTALLTLFCKTYPEAQVAVFAAPNEKEQVLPLLKTLPKDQCLDMIGTHLLDCAAFIQGSNLLICNDSGLMHVGAAVNTPLIALFGPTDERVFGPWSSESPSPHRVVRVKPYEGPTTGYIKQRFWDKTCYMLDLPLAPVWDVLQERWEALGR